MTPSHHPEQGHAITKLLFFAVLVAGGLGLAACEPARNSGPLPYTTGTVQEQLRQQQLQNARSNPGMQNPAPISVNPGTTGIVHDTGGAGSVAAGAPTAVNPGTTGILREGVGAPTRLHRCAYTSIYSRQG